MLLQIQIFGSIKLLPSVTPCQALVCTHHPSIHPSCRHNPLCCEAALLVVNFALIFTCSHFPIFQCLQGCFFSLSLQWRYQQKSTEAHRASNLPWSVRDWMHRCRCSGRRCTLIERSLFTSLHLINISGDYLQIEGGEKRKSWRGNRGNIFQKYLEEAVRLQVDHFKDIAYNVSSQ